MVFYSHGNGLEWYICMYAKLKVNHIIGAAQEMGLHFCFSPRLIEFLVQSGKPKNSNEADITVDDHRSLDLDFDGIRLTCEDDVFLPCLF